MDCRCSFTRTGWLIASLLLVSFVLFLAETPWINILGAIALGGCLALFGYDDYRRGEMIINGRAITRSQNSLSFWIHFVLFGLIGMAFVIGLFLRGLGFIPRVH